MTIKRPCLSLLPLVLAACVAPATDRGVADPVDGIAAVDIGDLTRDGVQMQSFRSPEGYAQKSGLIAYEGPGWESDRVGWRVYLDDRNAIDIFGKRTPEPVLARVGRGEDYHAMADWGMDILKVGNSLGAGGFGVFEDGEVRQIGLAEGYDAQVLDAPAGEAAVRVTHRGSQACGGDIAATYTAVAGSRLADVVVKGDCDLPIAAGMVIHPDTSSHMKGGSEGWSYKARWGDQSLVPDALGLAIFFRGQDVTMISADDDDDYVVFRPGAPASYKIGAAWAQEDGTPIRTEDDFKAWLDSTLADLQTQDAP